MWIIDQVDLPQEGKWISLLKVDEEGQAVVVAYINSDHWSLMMDSYDEIQKVWERNHLEF